MAFHPYIPRCLSFKFEDALDCLLRTIEVGSGSSVELIDRQRCVSYTGMDSDKVRVKTSGFFIECKCTLVITLRLAIIILYPFEPQLICFCIQSATLG